MKIFFKVILSFYFVSLNNNFCDDNCIKKIDSLKKEVSSYENKSRLTKKDLIRIVIPEFISYDEKRDEFERYLIKVFYSLNNDRFKKISFGPFQMQSEFILSYSIYNDYSDIIKNIDTISSLNSQYKILQNFVNKNPSLEIKDLINLYNSGQIKLDLKFKKNNYKLTYYEYSNYLINNFYE